MTSAVGTISSLSRFPVKSMLGEALDTAEVGPGGIAGDRAYAIVDRETGKVASAKHPKVWPDLLACRAIFTEEPVAGAEAPPAELELKDGTTVRTDAADVDDVLSRFFGRGVELARSAPEDFTIDQYHPDLENLDPQGHRDELTESKLGAALFREMGAPSAVPEGSFLDVCPLSVLSTSTLQRLGELQPDSRFDPRRFRMNVIVDTSVDGFAENAWIGHTLALGDDVRIVAIMPDPRCVMTTVAQGDLPRDPQILKALAQHNRLDVAGGGLYPCAGVYAVTESGGAIRTSDPVALV
jgi:uncharacterized protein YcbX